MPRIIDIPTFSDQRGDLTVIEEVIPFEIKRVYYLYNVSKKRGGHRHKKTKQLLICINGSCEIFVDNNKEKTIFQLKSPKDGLLVEAEDWHTMDKFSNNAILLVLASEPYNINDYIDKPYDD